MKTIPTLTWYLEMLNKPRHQGSLPEGFLFKEWHPSTDDYLSLYKAVGGNYHWFDRIIMPVPVLEEIIRSKHTRLLLLETDGSEAGFAELSLSVEGEIEIVYFGICEAFTGKKIGYPFLSRVIEYAWSFPINRLWLHTCDLDHPAALPLYQKAGLSVYKTETVMQPIKE